MKARTIEWGIATAALVALLLAPGIATAARPAPRVRVTPATIDQEVTEQGSNGFRVSIAVHDRRRLKLTALRLDKELSFRSAVYEMPIQAASDPDEIEARFGSLGRIDMHFEAEGVKRIPAPRRCEGDPKIVEEGFWYGFLAFHGEQGFTEVKVHSTLGSVVRRPSLRCRPEKGPDPAELRRRLKRLEREQEEHEDEAGPEEEDEIGPPPIKLEVSSKDPDVTFVAQRVALDTGRKKTSISTIAAVADRRRGPIRETGGVLAGLAPGSYVRPTDATDPLAEFAVKPGGPFTGSATYRTHRAAPPTWSGDLKAEIPGFGEVGLAGRRTRAVACESLFTDCPKGPGARASSLLRRTLSQGSPG